MQQKKDINYKLIKKYKKTFLNIYSWVITLIFLLDLGFFIFKAFKSPQFYNLINFGKTIIPSFINMGLYYILKKRINSNKEFINYYIFFFLFAFYSFSLINMNPSIILCAPILILLSCIFLIDKNIIKRTTIICLITNFIYSIYIFHFFNFDIYQIITNLFFSGVLLCFACYNCCVVINYLNDFFDENVRMLKRQDILQQNINKAVSDLKIEPMTKLFNKRAMQEAIDVKINNFNTKGIEAYLAILDLDYFKRVNDTYGHDVGDIVLINLANFLKKKLEKKANAFRFGGEEFVIIFDKYNKDEVFEILEDIRKSFAKNKFKEMQGKNITLSIGFTKIKNNDNKETFLKRADEALYQSKENGRNQTTYK